MAVDAEPIILLTFANEQGDGSSYLRNLPEECRALRDILDDERAPFAVRDYPNLTVDQLLNSLQRFRNRIVVFHFGGHSDNSVLQLESALGERDFAYAEGLADLLAKQHNLRLVFLNGCYNRAQAELLLNRGIPVVIATVREIDDSEALEFARRFYTAFVENSSIQDAFDQAQSSVILRRGARDGEELPWQLLWGKPTALAWRLSDITDNPCWGLPALPILPIAERPFRNLAWYRRQDAALFFGRCAEIGNLLEQVTAPKAPPIILLYGQSGVGKSSLLDAGLTPRLEQDAYCVYVRRNLESRLTAAICVALDAAEAGEPSLRKAWLDCEAAKGKPVVIIVDQVEETYTQVPGAESQSVELAELLLELTELFGPTAEPPRGKLILGFRKEYLAEIESEIKKYKLPASKIFLEPLDFRGVVEAITSVAQTPELQRQYGLTVEEGLAQEIAHDLLSDWKSPVGPTLQVLLSKMWDQAVARDRSHPRFDTDLYYEIRRQGLALDDFLKQQLQKVQDQDPATHVAAGLVLDLLHFHTTAAGTAAQHTRSEILQTYRQHPADYMSSLVDHCTAAYMLVDPAEDREAERMTRLAHDALAPLVSERFHRSVAPGQRARRVLEDSMIERSERDLLDDRDLALINQGAGGMRARTDTEEELVQASQIASDGRRRRQRSVILAAIVMLALLLLYNGYVVLRDQAQEDLLTRQESQWLADLSLKQLTSDPVASLAQAQAALPSADMIKLYVPSAEFALTQAVRTNLQRNILQVAAAPLAEEQVAQGAEYLAIGGDALRLVPYTRTQVVTLAEGAGSGYQVVWDATGSRLLSHSDLVAEVWEKAVKVASQQFAEPLICSLWRPQPTPPAANGQIAVCSGTALRLWDYQAQTVANAHDFTRTIAGASWSPDGRWLVAWDTVTSDAKATLLVWDVQAQAPRFLGQLAVPGPLLSVAWSPAGAMLLLQADAISLWEVDSQNAPKVLAEAEGIERAVFFSADHAIVWGTDVIPTRLSVRTQTPEITYGAATDNVADIQLTPDGHQLLVFLQDGPVEGYSLESGEQVFKLIGHTRRIRAASWQGEFLATSGADGAAYIWNMVSDEPDRQPDVALLGHRVVTPGRADVLGAHWLADGQLLTYGLDGTVRFWQVFDQERHVICTGNDGDGYPRCQLASSAYGGYESAVESARWLDAETILSVDSAGTARRTSVATHAVLEVLNSLGYDAEVLWSLDGLKLFSYIPGSRLDASEQSGGAIYDVETHRQIAAVPGRFNAAFWLGDGILVSPESTAAALLDPTTGETIVTLQGITATVTAVATWGEQQLALGLGSGEIIIWDRTTNHRSALLKPPPGPGGRIDNLAWTQDGKQLLAVGAGVRMWEIGNGVVVWPAPSSSADSNRPFNTIHAALSPDDRLVAVADNYGFTVLNAVTGTPLWENLAAHQDTIHGVAWLQAPVWPHQDRYGAIWGPLADWLTGVVRPRGGDRLLLLTWSGDGLVKLWDWSDRAEIMRVGFRDTVTQAAISPDGSQLLTGYMTYSGLPAEMRIWSAWRDADGLLQSIGRATGN
jgi:WD40 repeat protein